MTSCPILTSLCYLLDDSFEIEIKEARMERIEKGMESSVLIGRVLVPGVWFDAGAVFWGINGSCSFILGRYC